MKKYKYYFQKGIRHYFGRGYVYHIYRTNNNKDWEEIVYCENRWIPSVGPDNTSREEILPVKEKYVFMLLLDSNEIFGIREKHEIEDDIKDRKLSGQGILDGPIYPI